MKYWAVGINQKIDDKFLSQNKWWTDYPESDTQGKKIRDWIKKRVNIGDKVALKTRNIKGKFLKVFAIGEVKEKFNDFSGFKINWIKLNPPIITNSTYGQTKTIGEIHDKNALKEIFNLHNENKDNQTMNIKNIILYGPPGVGKTHNINKLINLIEDGYDEREIFDLIRENEESNDTLDEDLSKRVKFITFHQSFGYEDFIEGFRPNEDGKIGLEDGIFKDIILKAKKNMNFELFLEDIKNKEIIFETERGEVKAKKNNKNGYNLTNNHTLPKAKILDSLKVYHEFYIDNNREINKDELLGKVNFNETYKYTYNYFTKALYEIFTKDMVKYRKNHYLIIDEINRGNISKIFGELITLIEESKRDKLEVILPYSKEPFSVPSNLFIIGTMNSSDKSIALIDIALRRRWTFLKMNPNEELVPYIARDYFIKLNSKIEEKLGSDFKIGHSYFMKIKTQEDLDFVESYKIKPLLEEYFYGDSVSLKEVLDIIV